MSRWTHFAGCIRVDSIQSMMPRPKFDEIFKTCTFESNERTWKECNVPKGSEGSIQVTVVTNPKTSSMAAYAILIYGDLRDFGSKEDIESVRIWFDSVCKQLVMIRQAVLQLFDTSDENSCVLEYKEEEIT